MNDGQYQKPADLMMVLLRCEALRPIVGSFDSFMNWIVYLKSQLV
jgi:hypothetical protein